MQNLSAQTHSLSLISLASQLVPVCAWRIIAPVFALALPVVPAMATVMTRLRKLALKARDKAKLR